MGYQLWAIGYQLWAIGNRLPTRIQHRLKGEHFFFSLIMTFVPANSGTANCELYTAVDSRQRAEAVFQIDGRTTENADDFGPPAEK
jgi:hypothetical protein